MFLLFGDARAVLIDTGATASPEYFPLRTVIDNLVTEWLAGHARNDYPLLVLHSHSHGDHVAGDGQFADRPRTTVVDARLAAVADYLGLTTDLERPARLDLGGRTLDCIARSDEPPLEMTVDQLHEIRRAIGEIGDQPGRYVYPEFVIYTRARDSASWRA
jgi:hydroxyacylglutathione hydrolase